MKPTGTEMLLAEIFPGLKPLHRSGKCDAWWLPPGPGCGARVGLSVDGSWATLQLNARHPCQADRLEALAEHSAWPGGVKHVGSGHRPVLRVDVPLLVESAAGRAWVVRQLHLSAQGLQIAVGRQPHTEAPPEDAATEADPELTAQALATCGWNIRVKPDGAIRIDVEVRRAPWTVMLEACAGATRASVTVAASALAQAPAPCRDAAGLLLTRASSALRWARPFVTREREALASTGFECFVAAPPDDRALRLAVDTLLAACERFGLEIEALLEHPELAQRYLEYVFGMRPQAPDDVPSAGIAAARPPAPSPTASAVGF